MVYNKPVADQGNRVRFNPILDHPFLVNLYVSPNSE